MLAKIRKLKGVSDEEELAYVADDPAARSVAGGLPGWIIQLKQFLLLFYYQSKGITPKHWRKYKSPISLSLGHWLDDFAKRLQQVDCNVKRLTTGNKQLAEIWLGGLFMPEAFITATRQTVAQRNQWSLEELEMQLTLQSTEHSFPLIGLCIQGAEWSDESSEGKIQLSRRERSSIDKCFITWIRQKSSNAGSLSSSSPPSSSLLLLPIYLSSDRSTLLFQSRFPVSQPAMVYKRGVALLANSY